MYFLIILKAPLTASITARDPLCYGNANGMISVTPSGKNQIYKFNISNNNVQVVSLVVMFMIGHFQMEPRLQPLLCIPYLQDHTVFKSHLQQFKV